MRAQANIPDYQVEADSFSWQAARELLDGLENGKLNIAYEAIDRHVKHSIGSRIAIRWIAKDRTRTDYSYHELMVATNRFANVLRQLGIKKGETVYSLLGRVPELYICAVEVL